MTLMNDVKMNERMNERIDGWAKQKQSKANQIKPTKKKTSGWIKEVDGTRPTFRVRIHTFNDHANA